ncbi:MAG: hemerythrin domain-containing protein [Gammaproteobacteria bacterium]|nr:hemerythrin domain-containing protein [Gammaproteobacteria bacterium]
MSAILGRLSTDHRNMSFLLDLFEKHVGRLEEGDDSGLELLHEIIRYMNRYADHTHHPVENAMYAKMLEAIPERCEGLEFLTRQHAALEQSGSELNNLFTRALGGDVVIRAELVSAARNYLQDMRRHMSSENERFFVIANQALGSIDWADIETTLDEQKDPIFDSILSEDFRQLFNFIKEESERDGLALPGPLAGS